MSTRLALLLLLCVITFIGSALLGVYEVISTGLTEKIMITSVIGLLFFGILDAVLSLIKK